MSTSLALYTPMEQIEMAKGVFGLATSISETAFVPKHFRGKPQEIMACMVKGAELGIPLMQSLAQIYVIEGKIGIAAELMRGLALAHGHEIEVVESSGSRCIIRARRAGKETWQTFTRTIEDAKTAGLLGNPAWRKFPADMLLARTSSATCRALFPDAIGGMSYTMEELQAGDDTVELDSLEGSPPAAAAPRTARARQAATRGAAPVANAEPPAARPVQRGELPPLPGDDDIVDADIVDDPGDVPQSGGTMSGPARIAMLMGQHGVTDRDGKLLAIEQIIGRRVASSKDLSPEQMSSVIMFLNALAEGEPFPFDVAAGEVPPGSIDPVDAKADATPSVSPPSLLAASHPADEWPGDEWRKLLGRYSGWLKMSDLLKQAKVLASDAGRPVPVKLDDICDCGIGGMLFGWVEDRALGEGQ